MNFRNIFFFLLLTGAFSCTKNFDEINHDPNHPTEVEPDFLLTSSILNTMDLYDGSMNRVVFFNYAQHFSGFQGEFQRYTYSDGNNNTYWANTYIECLQPLHQIEIAYRDNPAYKNRVYIARIWKDYILSNTVSIWGGIPTDAALNGDPAIPYTKEEDLYYTLLDDLKSLADSIDLDGDRYSEVADKIYQGNLLKWKKFANTLRLKLAIRISNPAPNGNPQVAEAVVREIAAEEENTITNDGETAAAKWGTTSDVWNPLYNEVIYEYTANKAHIPVVNESLIYYTVPYNDPRITVYAQPAAQGPREGEYFGQNIAYGGGSGYARFPGENPHTNLKQDDYSYIGEWFLKPDAEFVFLSDAESKFLKAEAALKGWWPNGSAESYYYSGIESSFAHYGLSASEAQAYENTPGIRWGTASDTTGREVQFYDWLGIATSYIGEADYLRQIVMQYWLAIPMQELEAWTLIRRTRLLDFEPQFASYSGEYLYVPQRLPYPSSEYKTNTAEVLKAVQWLGGPDDLYTKLWFALPIKKNPYLPY
jgi:hypothetical protein